MVETVVSNEQTWMMNQELQMEPNSEKDKEPNEDFIWKRNDFFLSFN